MPAIARKPRRVDKVKLMITNIMTFGIIDTLQKAISGYFSKYSQECD